MSPATIRDYTGFDNQEPRSSRDLFWFKNNYGSPPFQCYAIGRFDQYKYSNHALRFIKHGAAGLSNY